MTTRSAGADGRRRKSAKARNRGQRSSALQWRDALKENYCCDCATPGQNPRAHRFEVWHAIGTAYIPASLHRSFDQADLPTQPATMVLGHGRAAHDHGAAGDRPRRDRDDTPLALALLGVVTCSGQNSGLVGRGTNALSAACLARCTAAFQA